MTNRVNCGAQRGLQRQQGADVFVSKQGEGGRGKQQQNVCNPVRMTEEDEILASHSASINLI